jgi:hypothetical protein
MHLIHSIRLKTHILERSGPFCYSMKVDAKLAELVLLTHKCAKRSGVEIFRNKRTHSIGRKTHILGHSEPFR